MQTNSTQGTHVCVLLCLGINTVEPLYCTRAMHDIVHLHCTSSCILFICIRDNRQCPNERGVLIWLIILSHHRVLYVPAPLHSHPSSPLPLHPPPHTHCRLGISLPMTPSFSSILPWWSSGRPWRCSRTKEALSPPCSVLSGSWKWHKGECGKIVWIVGCKGAG